MKIYCPVIEAETVCDCSDKCGEIQRAAQESINQVFSDREKQAERIKALESAMQDFVYDWERIEDIEDLKHLAERKKDEFKQLLNEG